MALSPSSSLSADRDPKLIDSPRMRSAGRALLSLALMDARNHTLHLLGQYEKALNSVDAELARQEGLNPALWTAGHIGWFQEWWIARNLQRALGLRCEAAHARLGSLQSDADRFWDPAALPPAARWTAALPDMDRCRAYLLDTLENTLELLEKAGDDDDALYFYRLCLFYEDLQCEALTQDAQTLGLTLDRPLQEAFSPAPMAQREALLLPATTWQMGSAAGPGSGFAFAHEKARHAVAIPEFEIDAQPVSWSQYVEFVGDGAYDCEAFWHPEGWRWLQDQAAREGRRGPRYVEQIGIASGAVVQTRFGQTLRMQGQQPALHVSWWEADAWCRWAGRRLPAEVEWEVAAHTASRRGFRWGEVWEWTGTTFGPYPGYAPDPGQAWAQPGPGVQKVLRGASFATRARMKHPNFRKVQSAGCDTVFAGFRSCSLSNS